MYIHVSRKLREDRYSSIVVVVMFIHFITVGDILVPVEI